MKKILLAFDQDHFSDVAFEYARRMNESESILLIGLFIPLFDCSTIWGFADSCVSAALVTRRHSPQKLQAEININRFENLCQKNGIAYRVSRESDDHTLTALARESRYADLLILDSEAYFTNTQVRNSNNEFQHALKMAECPVMVVADQFDVPVRNLLVYDGSDSSVYAIKQFAYIFPERRHNETLLLFSASKSEDPAQENDFVKELASQHFSDLHFASLHQNAAEYLGNLAGRKNGLLLVCGASARNFFSRKTRQCPIARIVAQHRLPVFMAHRNRGE